MRDLNYNHLRYFWAVAHEGSLTRAAERMHLSQSALSVQIQKLEHQMGHPLFERVGKRLVLTEAGKIALDYADTVFEAGEELMSTLRGRPVASRQVLRVGALTTLSRNFQLEFLRPLIGRSDVELIVRSGNMRDLIAQLEAHAIDVVLANSAAERDARSSLRNHLLDEQPVSLVGRPRRTAGPSAGAPENGAFDKGWAFRFPDDLATEPLLLPSLDSAIRVAFDRVLERHGIRPIILAEVDDMAMLRLLARERDGATLVPPIVVRDELESGVLVEFCRIPEVSETFYAIVQNRRFPNRLLDDLIPKIHGAGAR
ncbi:LysR family transcriptional regulator [Methyloraptor flagellatus]|jgi:LysR family transcriptional activator of nhaA|uniref:LysR family transcriptional regulator n=1 Tax=Methyloraptor flagellatus TaxID=3162530 RepID=A0AAU7XGJ4_9HYPH